MVNDDLRIQKGLFAISDTLAISGACAAALALHDPSSAIVARFTALDPPLALLAIGFMVVLWLAVFRSAGLYRMRAGGWPELLALSKTCALGLALVLMAGFAVHVRISRLAFCYAYVLSVPFAFCARSLTRGLIRHLYANPRIGIPLAIVGFNPVARYLCDQILDDITPFEPVGFIDGAQVGHQYRGLPVLDEAHLPLAQLAEHHKGLEVAIALPRGAGAETDRAVAQCEHLHLGWWIVPSAPHALGGGLRVEQLGAVALVGRCASNIEGLNYVIKRAFDLSLGTLMLLAAAPIIALAALAIALDDGGPILFRQTRVGAHGDLFTIFKLRTMKAGAQSQAHREYVREWIGGRGSEQTHKMTGDPRITRVGRWLRRFSIDELPQLFNVVAGQMSLIGPRPALPYELELYCEWHHGRLEGPPGLTGLWQVSGRNQLSFDDMVRLDLEYLADWSLGRDLRILARTLPVLLRGTGV